jgi:RNA polymerase sigma-70 factor (ECF subfamily)
MKRAGETIAGQTSLTVTPVTIPAVRDCPPDAGTMYQVHVHQVARWAERLAGPSLDVEDIVQEVFTIAQAKLGRFRGDSSALTWLFGITSRVVRHRRRKEKWRRWLTGSADQTAGNLPSSAPDPLRMMERAQAAARVYQVLDRLSERDRQVLILFELEDLCAEEVGQLLGIQAGNARLRLHRARVRFGHVYEDYERQIAAERRNNHVSR